MLDEPSPRAASAMISVRALARIGLVFLILGASLASADGRIGPFNLYTIDGRFADPDRTSTLYRIDPETGEVLETIGDTGLRLNAITLWPEGNRLIGVTSSFDPVIPDHLVELDLRTADYEVLATLSRPQPNPPQLGPLEFRDLAVFPSADAGLQLGLIRRRDPDDATTFSILFASSFPDGQIANLPVQGPTGPFALARADWQRPFLLLDDLAVFGCRTKASYLGPPVGGPIIDPPPNPPIFFDLPQPSCFASGTQVGASEWLGVQVDPDESAPRRLARIELVSGQALLSDLGPLPDNTVGIALGPAFPVEPVPALSRVGLIVLLALVALVVFLRLRGRA